MTEIKDDKKEIKDDTKKGTGPYKMHLDSKIEDTATDVYYKTEKKLPDSKVAIPTEDSVDEAKKWVDDVNRM